MCQANRSTDIWISTADVVFTITKLLRNLPLEQRKRPRRPLTGDRSFSELVPGVRRASKLHPAFVKQPQLPRGNLGVRSHLVRAQ